MVGGLLPVSHQVYLRRLLLGVWGGFIIELSVVLCSKTAGEVLVELRGHWLGVAVEVERKREAMECGVLG